jgi:hypothetical protein
MVRFLMQQTLVFKNINVGVTIFCSEEIRKSSKLILEFSFDGAEQILIDSFHGP